MLIALVSTLISSIALVGVAIGLLLQARQLRITQMQVSRASQIELIKFYFSNPEIVTIALGAKDSKQYAAGVLTNWYVTHLALSYESNGVSETHLRNLAKSLFQSEVARQWWTSQGQTYCDGATSKREKEFFKIVNIEYQRIMQENDPVKNGTTP